VAFTAFCLGLIVYVLLDDIPRAINGSLTGDQWFFLILFTGGLTWILVIAIRGLSRKRRGAQSISIDSNGIEFELPDRNPIRLNWNDPSFELELQDLRNVDQRMLSTTIQFFVVAGAIQSALTREAFEALIAQAKLHGLTDSVGPPTHWFAPSRAIYHTIRREREQGQTR